MTDNVRLMFEVDSLQNASPATVSRAGVVYVSDVDLDWSPLVQAFLTTLHPTVAALYKTMFDLIVSGDESQSSTRLGSRGSSDARFGGENRHSYRVVSSSRQRFCVLVCYTQANCSAY